MQQAIDDKRRGVMSSDPVGVDGGLMWCDFPGLRPELTNMTPSGSTNCWAKLECVLLGALTSDQCVLIVFAAGTSRAS